MDKIIVRTPDQPKETFAMIGEQFTVLVAGEETASYEAFIQVVPPGAGPPLHSHPWDEAFYVLSGELNFSTADENLHAVAGTFVHFPAGSPHTFASPYGTATILSLTFGPGAAAFFRESNRINRECPGDLAKLLAVGPRHGVRLHESPEEFKRRAQSIQRNPG